MEAMIRTSNFSRIQKDAREFKLFENLPSVDIKNDVVISNQLGLTSAESKETETNHSRQSPQTETTYDSLNKEELLRELHNVLRSRVELFKDHTRMHKE